MTESQIYSTIATDTDLKTKQVKTIARLRRRVASKIVERREKEGVFSSRSELKEVDGIGEFRFQQSAGFMRIPGSGNPLDTWNGTASAWHWRRPISNLINAA